MKSGLSCSIVQDLLPNYVEKLTHAETDKAVEEHLESCKKCREVYKALSADVIAHKKSVPMKELNFLKKIKRTRLLAALLSIVLALTFSYLLYSSEYKYTSDKGVLSAAITD
ncbi:MAG: zf-HC2 domain-containing protein [Dethiobacteria bacterium]|jgi:predicted anti-sigma-YlaC factor YlaD|nr:zf-HC2 domain-containing protein [Bacillota bacterium]